MCCIAINFLKIVLKPLFNFRPTVKHKYALLNPGIIMKEDQKQKEIVYEVVGIIYHSEWVRIN